MPVAGRLLAQALLAMRRAMCISPLIKNPVVSCWDPHRRLGKSVLLLAGLLPAGCALHPVNPAPEPGVATAGYTAAATAAAAAPREAAWWESLHSDRLNGYVERSLHTSRTIEAAQARLAQADAVYFRAAAALRPSLDLKAHSERDLKTSAPRGEYREFGPALSWGPCFRSSRSSISTRARSRLWSGCAPGSGR